MKRVAKHLRIIRFLIVGGLCAGLNLALLSFLTGNLGIHYLVATLISFATVNALGFLLNKYYTFGRSATDFLPELTKYYATMLTSVIANVTLMYVLVDLLSLHYLIASIVVMAILTIANFLTHSGWTFGGSR